ncbi:tRNA (guanine(46)-N(7))-methyltransferase TrmB [Rhodoblastus sp. 17X3]|uniref:tRNA (guanine(46)-N(7))-methyltransferase TrmB n=1 Tax=Rhodoblastus sp. 17X3 TaxID=3047026 RepID=UPI0024B6803B|nr:tRNA (guanine(46)-N(7))-methyltransferase TrmB [Rhodoblastus sp. 17X3]MDI9849872.1 tRNA (guanine(46)-N(7))-methyltransferase TrmB [Rhodoblastus sp. 17X3]
MNSVELEQPRRARRDAGLYGRRKGKTLRPYQAGLVENLLPQLQIDLSQRLDDPDGLFPDRKNDLRLEIGFGGGEHLASDAQTHPERGYIGCEPFVNGVAKLLVEVETRALANIRIHPGDAGDLIDALPDKSLSGVCLLYPDPWPKRRHKERRFVSDALLARLARVMRPGAELRFATDIDDYAGWTFARILRSPDFIWPARSVEDWIHPWAGWPGTRYEAKALREGRRPVYLSFIRR